MEKNNKGNKRTRNRRPNGFNNVVTRQQVKQMIESKMDKVQCKYLNTSVYNAVVPASYGTLVQPTLPAQGVTNGQREGDSLAIDEIEAKVIIYNVASSGTDANDACRLMCLQARASTVLTISNTSSPITGVLDLGSSGSVDLTSFVNLNAQNELFHVLYDRTFPVVGLSSTAFREHHLRLKPSVSKVNFTPTTTTSQCGGIFWIVISELAAGVTVSLEQRLVYHDL
jgi:hypothetical protein